MARKRAASRRIHPKAVPQKNVARRQNSRWVALLFAILLVVGVVGTLVFQGQEGTGGAKPISVLRTEDFHSLAFSPDDPNVVFFGHHDGILRSSDGGRTWQPLVNRTNFDAMSLAIAHNDSRLMYLAGHDIFQVSRDGGITWSRMNNTLPGTDIHGFTVSPEAPQRFFAYVFGHGFFRSRDGGLTWEKMSTQLPSDIMAVAASGGDPGTLFAGSMESGAFRSTDGGKTWVAVTGLGAGGVMAIAIDTEDPDTVYAGGTTGLYKSTDGGDSWLKLNSPGKSIVALAISPAQPGLLLVINVARERGDVYRSEDGGMTWIR